MESTYRDFAQQVDLEALIRRTSLLIESRTVNPPGNEAALADRLAGELRSLGLETGVVPLGPNRASVVGRLRGDGDRPALVLSGHLDTVPPGQTGWTRDPFAPMVIDGKLYGLGAADMKGAVAAMIETVAVLRRTEARMRGDLILAFSASEETDSAGAATLVESGALAGAGALVIGEPTSNNVYVAEKGVAWIEVVTEGQTAHGSMPERGVNAIFHMAAVLEALERFSFDVMPHPMLGRPSLNVGTIGGGVAPNVVADRCVVTVDMRLIPGQSPADALAAVRATLDHLGRERPRFAAEARLMGIGRPPVDTDPAHPFVQLALDVASMATGRELRPNGVTYATDASVYVPALKAPMVICGPGQAHMAHQPDEWVEVDALVQSAAIYASIAARWLGV